MTVVLAASAACSGGGGGAEPSANSAQIDAGPLAEYLGDDGDLVGADESFRQKEADVARRIEACMAERGFEHTSPLDDGGEAYAAAYRLPPDEFTERHGLGISTFFTDELAISEGQDPNQERLDTMNDAEREAYEDALHGEAGATAGSDGEGCEGRAYRQVFQLDVGLDGPLAAALEDMHQRYRADPRVTDFWAEWSMCMAADGFDYATIDDARNALIERMEPVWSSVAAPLDDLSADQLAELSDEQVEELTSQPPVYDRALLAEVVDYEMALAATNRRCGGPAANQVDPAELRRIRHEYEQRFVDTHRDELEAISAAAR